MTLASYITSLILSSFLCELEVTLPTAQVYFTDEEYAFPGFTKDLSKELVLLFPFMLSSQVILLLRL